MKNMPVVSKAFAYMLIVSLVLFGAGYSFINTASAWSTGACTATNFNGGTPDHTLLASNGDVVTTNKWNAFVCNFVILGELIYGTGTDKKQSVFNFHPNASNSLGSSVSEIRLPTINGVSTDPAVGGIIAFYDPVGSYGASTARSAIASIEDAGGRGGLALGSLTSNSVTHLFNKKDSEDSAYAEANSLIGNELRRYALAWETVSMSDTSLFDIKCQYRFQSHGTTASSQPIGGYVYASLVGLGHLELISSIDGSLTNTSAGRLVVLKEAKNLVKYYDFNGLVTNAPIVRMQKLCLPTYTP